MLGQLGATLRFWFIEVRSWTSCFCLEMDKNHLISHSFISSRYFSLPCISSNIPNYQCFLKTFPPVYTECRADQGLVRGQLWSELLWRLHSDPLTVSMPAQTSASWWGTPLILPFYLSVVLVCPLFPARLYSSFYPPLILPDYALYPQVVAR